MARYMQVASEAAEVADELFAMVPEAKQAEAAEKIARLFNYGIRVSPRAVHSTVRINAISEAVKNLPISCRLEKVENNGFSFNALVTQAK